MEEAPNLKVDKKPGFVSFGDSRCTVVGGLAGSPGAWAGVDCSGVNGFGPCAKSATPNPANGVPDELLNENTDDVGPFCSKLVVARLGSIVVVVGRGLIFVDSGAGL